MEINTDLLEQKMDELRLMMEIIRSSNDTPKVNTDKLVATFDDEQLEMYKEMMELVQKLDRLIHSNFSGTVLQVVNAEVHKMAWDSDARTKYLVDVDKRSAKLEYDGDLVEMIRSAKKVKEQIEGLHQFLQSSGVTIPAKFYKHVTDEKGTKALYKTKAGNLLLDLPRIWDLPEDSADSNGRGRPARTFTLILGTVENDEVTWHENDHIGTTFMDLYGSIRAEHNPIGLFRAVDKSDQSSTTGWDTPVEYAGKRWVAKVRK